MHPDSLIAALLDVLRSRGGARELAAAFTPDARIDVHHQDPGLESQTLQEPAQIAAWFAATRGDCDFFTLPAEVQEAGPDTLRVRVRYGYHHDRYTAWGWWTITGRAGRIARLLHEPDPLPRTPREWWELHGERITQLPADEPIFPLLELYPGAPDDPAAR